MKNRVVPEPVAARVTDQGAVVLLFPTLKNGVDVGSWDPERGHHERLPSCPTLRHPKGNDEMRRAAELMGLYSKQYKTPLTFVKDIK